MQKLWMVLLVGLFVAGPGEVYANSDTPTYLNAKSMWSKFKWSEFANHKIMRIIPDNPDPHTETKNGVERSRLKEREVVLGGIKGTESVLVENKLGEKKFTYGVIFLSVESKAPLFCSKMTKHLTKIYGKPSGTIDLSRTIHRRVSKNSKTTVPLHPMEIYNAWVAGSTGIELACYDLSGTGKIETALISFKERSLVKIPKPITWIECNFEGAVHTPTGVKSKPAEVYTFGINDFQRKLHRRDKSSLGEVKTFSDGLITVAIKNEKNIVTVSIDRLTGIGEFKIVSQKNPRYYSLMKGPCAQTIIKRNRF